MSGKGNSSFSPKRITLIAHDNKKDDLLSWTEIDQEKLS